MPWRSGANEARVLGRNDEAMIPPRNSSDRQSGDRGIADPIERIEAAATADVRGDGFVDDFLIGRRGWVEACLQAAHSRPDWLRPFLPSATASVELPHPLNRFEEQLGDRAVSAARAVAGAAEAGRLLTMARTDPTAMAPWEKLLRDVATAWESAGHLDVSQRDQSAPAALATITSTGSPESLVRAALGPEVPSRYGVGVLVGEMVRTLASMRGLVVDDGPSSREAFGREVQVKVLFAYGFGASKGRVGLLTLTVRPSGDQVQPALVPDPVPMAFLQIDDDLRRSMRRAWAWATGRTPPRSEIRWRLELLPGSLPPSLPVGGPSLGAGFALGLLHLTSTPRPILVHHRGRG